MGSRLSRPGRFVLAVTVRAVIVGALTSLAIWLIVPRHLFATALVDVVLYLIVPDALMCYRCGAQYRMAEGMSRHGAFNLETHERHRQQVARLAGRQDHVAR